MGNNLPHHSFVVITRLGKCLPNEPGFDQGGLWDQTFLFIFHLNRPPHHLHRQ